MVSEAGRNQAQRTNGADASAAHRVVSAGVSSDLPGSPVPQRLADGHWRLEATIVNAMGIHLRPAHKIVTTCMKYPCRIWICKDDKRVDGKSIMQLIGLEAELGTRLILEAEGNEAEAALVELGILVSQGFNDELLPEAAPAASAHVPA